MTWATDDRGLYWQQRGLDARQAEAARRMEDRKVTRELLKLGFTKNGLRGGP